MQNFAGEMHHLKMRHLSSTLLDRDQGLELIVSFAAGASPHGGALHRRGQSQQPVMSACSQTNSSGSPRATQLILAQGASHQSSVGRRIAIVLPFRERGAQSTHRHHWPVLVSRHIHIFTTPAVRVQHEVTVHVIVKTSVQLGHTVAHPEWVSPPGNEQALRIHMDREVCQQQHISFLRAKPWPHRLIYPATSSTTAFRWECIRSRGAVTRCMPITRKIHQSNRPANVSSVGPCTEDHSDQLLASVEAAWDPCDRDRVTDMITHNGQVKLVDASPALSQTKHANMCTWEQLGTSK